MVAPELFSMPTPADGIVQILWVFGLALIGVLAVALFRHHLVHARTRAMRDWAARRTATWQAAADPPAWLVDLPLWQRLEHPRIANLITDRGGSVLVFDLEFLQMQVSGHDAAGCTVIALHDPRGDLPPFRLIPDCWDPLDGPEPIRTGMAAGDSFGPTTWFDDRAADERRAGMLREPPLADLPIPYLLTDTRDGRTRPWLARLGSRADTLDGVIRFEGRGQWLIAYVDRRATIQRLPGLIEQAEALARTLRSR